MEAKRNKVALDVKLLEARALSELFEYIKESMQEEKYLFKLEELHSLFINRLRCYGIETTKNKTRLKEKILEEFPDATEQTDGKNTIIAFPDGMKRVMRDAMMKQDHSYKAEILSQAAKIVREEALDMKYDKFDGSFKKECQEAYVPPNLGILVSMLLNGVNISETPLYRGAVWSTTLFRVVFHTTPTRM